MKNQKTNQKRADVNKLKMPDLSHHLIEFSEGSSNVSGSHTMVNTLAGRISSLLEPYKASFDENSSCQMSDDDNFYMAINLKLLVEDIAAVLVVTQEFEDNEKEKLPLALNCFDFLAEYIDGARVAISALMNHFGQDKPEKNDEKIVKVLESLKLAIENINDIFGKYCCTKKMLQA